MFRRIQSLVLILPLLSVPAALLAWNCTCTPAECGMACCRGHQGMMSGMMGGMIGGMRGMCGTSNMCACMKHSRGGTNLQATLILPPPPLQLTSSPVLEAPRMARAFSNSHAVRSASGFALLPFQPPRA